jgi:2,4-diaminopentanoate dehydrogenase
VPYKVIQWSSGNVGRHAVAAVAKRPDLNLVGMYVYAAAKVGRDAGEVAGTGKLGVETTNDLQRLLALDADVVIHSPLPSLVYGDDPLADVKTICRLLESGKNVITTVGYLYPKAHGPQLVRKIESACRKGNSTFHSTGLNPGWMGDLLPLTMSALSSRIDQIYVKEVSNFQHYPSPEIMFDMMGFGKTPSQFRRHVARYSHWLNGLFVESIRMVADGLRLKLDRVSSRTSRALAPGDLQTAAGVVRAGTVAGQHWLWAGEVARRKVIVHETVWRMHDSVAPDWPTGNHAVAVSGEPNIRIELAPSWIDGGLVSTAMHAVNAIPYVCEAAPGIKTLIDLPLMTGKGSFSGSTPRAAKKPNTRAGTTQPQQRN